MSGIDWSKAPEGTTHWGPEQTSGTSSYVECWFKIEDGTVKSYCCADMVEDGWHRYKGHMPEERKLALVERHAAWTGAGLPPVGTVCEIQHESLGWTRCEIVAHKVMDSTGVTMAIAWIDANTLDQSQGIRFRPIRTQAQIEAEERRANINDIERVMRLGLEQALTITEIAASIHDAGYRKQGEAK